MPNTLKTGKSFENIVGSLFMKSKAFNPGKYKTSVIDWLIYSQTPSYFHRENERLAVIQPIINTKKKPDMVVYDSIMGNSVLEFKYQNVVGSTHEKFDYVSNNVLPLIKKGEWDNLFFILGGKYMYDESIENGVVNQYIQYMKNESSVKVFLFHEFLDYFCEIYKENKSNHINMLLSHMKKMENTPFSNRDYIKENLFI